MPECDVPGGCEGCAYCPSRLLTFGQGIALAFLLSVGFWVGIWWLTR